MAQIIPKLNLNRTPSIVENNSFVYASNIRADVDATIHRDYSIMPMSLVKTNLTGSQYNNYHNTIYRIIDNLQYQVNNNNKINKKFYNNVIAGLTKISQYPNTVFPSNNHPNYGIVGIIPNNNEFYLFISGSNKTDKFKYDCIICYDEKLDTFTPCNCNWHYSGGQITGNVINNLNGDKLLNIGEKTTDTTLIPFKSINLSESKYTDDESIYTQSPNIPITNLSLNGRFEYTVPNGVYQFFVRYKIRDNFYTDWFPASKDIFIGNSNTTYTNFGTLTYCETKRDSDNSVIFKVEHLFPKYQTNYESFQIGFILSHDDTIVARAWKHFTFDKALIKFDYDATIETEEIEVIDLIQPTYQLYDVQNITNFKNKLYISNYIESNFNEDLREQANKIKIEITQKKVTNGYNGHDLSDPTTLGNKDYFSTIKINNEIIPIGGANSIAYRLFNQVDSLSNLSITDYLTKCYNNEEHPTGCFPKYDGFVGSALCDIINIENLKIDVLKSDSNAFDFNFENDEVDTILLNDVEINSLENLKTELYNRVAYLDRDSNFVTKDGTLCSSNKITFIRSFSYKTKRFKPGNVDISGEITNSTSNPNTGIVDDNINNIGGEEVEVLKTHRYNQNIDLYIGGNKSYMSNNNIEDILDYTTLIPYQKYKFYIHYVKQSGEVSNGYYCGGVDAGIITAPYKESCDSLIYPVFKNITIPSGYVGCFFSIFNCAVKSATVYDLEKVLGDGTSVKCIEGYCADINIGKFPIFKECNIKQTRKITTSISKPEYDLSEEVLPPITKTELKPISEEINTTDSISKRYETLVSEGIYHHSTDTSDIRYFGGNGIITFESKYSENINTDKLAYVVTDYESQQTEDLELVKCTPYITSTEEIFNYDNYLDLNLLGYICEISRLDKKRCIGYYTDGSTVFKKDLAQSSSSSSSTSSSSSASFKLQELSKFRKDNKWEVLDFDLINTTKVAVYSNYNLNYLTIGDHPVDRIITYYNREENDTSVSDENNKSFQTIWRLIASANMSSVYNLPSMYHNYTRKLYYSYNMNNIYTFNNTVRSSILNGDEADVHLFKFHPNDYYNVPTNRGKIVNLVAIGDAILVHTEDSMFRFAGSNNLSSSDGDILTKESQPFDTGISEIFGSDFGYAGLYDKKESIITEDGYIFYDRDSNVIYMYSGNNQMIKLNDSIEKLFKLEPINKITFANDYYNNRFFVCIKTESNKSYTLSFCTLESIKSFISLHDFSFDNAFNTKTKCYFYNIKELYKIDTTITGCYALAESNNNLYPKISGKTSFNVINKVNTINTNYTINNYDSIIDIIQNPSYEVVKTVNSIEWCSNLINDYFNTITSDTTSTIKLTEGNYIAKPCKGLLLYTDTCTSNYIDCNISTSNAYSITDTNSYKYPRYNQGKWSLNYFRNTENTSDPFDYLTNYDDNRQNAQFRSDNNSLIEGKYIVVRFYFNKPFKLETLNINYNNKL